MRMSEHLRPSQAEREFFFLEDVEKLRRMAAERRKRMAKEKQEELRLRHFNRCPRCGDELHAVKLHDVVTSRCFNCGGCWIDEPDIRRLVRSNGRKVVEAVLNIFDR